jgi:hypothetical protein
MALDKQRKAYMEKLEERRRKSKRDMSANNNNHSKEKSVEQVLLKTATTTIERKSDGEGTRESSLKSESVPVTAEKNSSEKDRKRKPRSAAIERILAMAKKKRVINPESSLDGTPGTAQKYYFL